MTTFGGGLHRSTQHFILNGLPPDNPDPDLQMGELFGGAVALSADGNTLAVGARGEDSNATGVNGDQNDNSAQASGAVYVY